MYSKREIVIIYATGKRGPFPDTLTKSLAGVPLLQRAINLALEITKKSQVYIVSDTEEIGLISERNGVVSVTKNVLFDVFSSFANEDTIVSISPYCPLLTKREINNALKVYKNNKSDFLVPIKRHASAAIRSVEDKEIVQYLAGTLDKEVVLTICSDFHIFSPRILENTISSLPSENRHYFELSSKSIEIRNPEDWWVCEKFLRRKRIIFRVIGSKTIGMGHIYRALTLAHEITDHEVLFVCDEESEIVVKKLTGMEYRYEVFPKKGIINEIIKLQPDLLINDILNTRKKDVSTLRKKNIKVLNFEDFGTGATEANLTINEMFDKPVLEGANILWGKRYYFVRDEFNDAKPHLFKSKIDSLLITFGGTDQNDLTRKILFTVREYCQRKGIKIFVVTGSGYVHYDKLQKEAEKFDKSFLEITHATGVMSRIMERTPIAIASNGRTVYELAHMNIPGIIVPVNEREKTHAFANKKNGFFPLRGFNKNTPNEVLKTLAELVEDQSLRKKHFDRTLKFNFKDNKRNILNKIEELLH